MREAHADQSAPSALSAPDAATSPGPSEEAQVIVVGAG